MTLQSLNHDERRQWVLSGGIAFAVHAAIIGAVLSSVSIVTPPAPEPVVLVELPPMEDVPELVPTMAQTSVAPADAAVQPSGMAMSARPVTPILEQPRLAPAAPVAAPVSAPMVRAPLPSNIVSAAQPSANAAPVQPAVAAPASGAVSSAPAAAAASDPNARRQEVNYFALISSHLNRRKTYPAEARQARQQGIVSVRFTVDRSGGVSNISVRRSSGHDILDSATVALLQRVAPLPRMPAAMQRESITITLPIEYSLTTN